MRYLVACLAALAFGPAFAAAMPPVAQVCVACHGEQGANPWPDVPNIGGLSEVLLYNALWDYRAGERPCREPACTDAGNCPDLDMCQVTEGLTDDQIDRLARTFSAFPFQAVDGKFDAQLAADGRTVHYRQCDMCHADGGTSSREGAAILRGQKQTYLRQALEDFQHGRRPVLETMLERVKALSHDQLETLVHFYASPPEGLRRGE
jgi:sulfide dehydrogenase cytochrome subunit